MMQLVFHQPRILTKLVSVYDREYLRLVDLNILLVHGWEKVARLLQNKRAVELCD